MNAAIETAMHEAYTVDLGYKRCVCWNQFVTIQIQLGMAGVVCAAIVETTKAPCTSKPRLPSRYCNKHRLLWERKDEVAAAGGRECKQLPTHVKRGCLGMLDADDKSCCKACKRMNAEKDKKVDAKREAAAVASLRSGQVVCNSCKKAKDESEFDARALQHESKGAYCRECREKREGVFKQKPEGKRVRSESYLEWRHRYDASDERKASKRARKEADPERFAQYWREYRARRLAEDPVGYRARQAARAKEWRDNNPELVHANAVKNRVNLKKSAYNTRVAASGVESDLTDEQITDMLEGTCFFCGDPDTETKLMGIGRLDCTKGFTVDNCRATCSVCIKMKGCLDARTFVERCDHIFGVSQGSPPGDPDDLFADHLVGVDFGKYKQRAMKKGLSFDISRPQFQSLVLRPCYICAKTTSKTHMNGIDRVDNSRGYEMDNIRPCCGECNYMKKGISIQDFLTKVEYIALDADSIKEDIPEDIKRRNRCLI